MNKYIPSLDKISQEVIATGIAVIVVAWIVASNPALKRLVKQYELN